MQDARVYCQSPRANPFCKHLTYGALGGSEFKEHIAENWRSLASSGILVHERSGEHRAQHWKHLRPLLELMWHPSLAHVSPTATGCVIRCKGLSRNSARDLFRTQLLCNRCAVVQTGIMTGRFLKNQSNSGDYLHFCGLLRGCQTSSSLLEDPWTSQNVPEFPQKFCSDFPSTSFVIVDFKSNPEVRQKFARLLQK